MKANIRYTLLLICMIIIFESKASKADTAVVKSYAGIPVFFNCKPLHSYTSLGKISRNTLVSHLEEGFEYYANEAKKINKGNIGIIINDIGFGADVFEIVEFVANDLHNDTAVYTTDIFLCATPIGKYELLGIIKNRHKVRSLNDRLSFYLNLAHEQYPSANAIILNDIEYNFELDEIKVIRLYR